MNLEFQITGQCPSGKNAVVITRSGHRFPGKRFVKWRDGALKEIQPQKNKVKSWLPLSQPVNVDIQYTAGDKRRRDAPGILDAIWHLLEKAEIVTDDTFLSGMDKKLAYTHVGVNKKNAGVKIKLSDGL